MSKSGTAPTSHRRHTRAGLSVNVAWILAGGAHHTGFSQCVTTEHLEDFAAMADIEFLLINKDTQLSDFKNELRWNDLYYHLMPARR